MNTTLGGVAILGAIAAGWTKIKQLLNYLRSIFIISSKLECMSFGTFREAAKQFNSSFKIIKLGNQLYRSGNFFGKSGYYLRILSRNLTCGKFFALYKGIFPIFGAYDYSNREITLTYPRYIFPFEKIAAKITRIYQKESRCWYSTNMWGSIGEDKSRNKDLRQDSGSEPKQHHNLSDIKDVVFCENYEYFDAQLSELIYIEDINEFGYTQKISETFNRYKTNEEKELYKNIKFWLESKEWYRKHDICWKRGCVIYGEAGTGKSSMIYNVSRELSIPIETAHLETFTNKDIFEKWQGDSNGKIILIEDIDSVFNGRNNVSQNNKTIRQENHLTFDALLNTIDGVNRNEGVFLIITTNHPEKLDHALAKYDTNKAKFDITRAGRIDFALHSQRLNEEGAEYLIDHILDDVSKIQRKEILNSLELPATAATIQETAMKYALEHRWNK